MRGFLTIFVKKMKKDLRKREKGKYQLTAAAPKLLAALIQAHDWIVAYIEDGDHSGPDNPEDWPIIMDMREAIAEASKGK